MAAFTITNGEQYNGSYLILKDDLYRSEAGGRNFYIVLAINHKDNIIVTWNSMNLKTFFAGHYFTDENAALADYHKRLYEFYDRKN